MSSLRRSRLSSPPRKTIKLEESIDDAEITIKHEEIDISETILKEEQDVDLPDLHPNVHSPMENDLNHKDTEIEDLDTPDLIETVEISELNHILEKNTIVVDRAYSQATSSNASPGNDLKNQDDSNMKSDELVQRPYLFKNESMRKAMFAVKIQKMSYTAASKMYGVSRVMLMHNLKNKTDGVSRKNFYQVVKDNLHILKVLADDASTNPHTTGGRSVLTPSFKEWYVQIEKYFKDRGLENIFQDPSRVFCAASSSFAICPDTGSVLAPMGERNMHKVKQDQQFLTVFIAVAADGSKAPPCVTYPCQDLIPTEIALSVPDQWGLGSSEKGKMTKEMLYKYLWTVFYKWLKRSNVTFPIIMFTNGIKKFITKTLHEGCAINGIILVTPPGHHTSNMHPCHVSILKPLIFDWPKVAGKFCTENSQVKVDKVNFAALFQGVYQSVTAEMIKNGFHRCGLAPLNAIATSSRRRCASRNESEDNNMRVRISDDKVVLTPAKPADIQKIALCYMEKFIPKETLDDFIVCAERQSGWTGSVAASELYNVWIKMRGDG